jgi:hypothetical protein
LQAVHSGDDNFNVHFVKKTELVDKKKETKYWARATVEKKNTQKGSTQGHEDDACLYILASASHYHNCYYALQDLWQKVLDEKFIAKGNFSSTFLLIQSDCCMC